MCKLIHSGGRKVNLLIIENERLSNLWKCSKKQYRWFGSLSVCSEYRYSMLNTQVRKCTHGTTFF